VWSGRKGLYVQPSKDSETREDRKAELSFALVDGIARAPWLVMEELPKEQNSKRVMKKNCVPPPAGLALLASPPSGGHGASSSIVRSLNLYRE
jgi:hypothetical protein